MGVGGNSRISGYGLDLMNCINTGIPWFVIEGMTV